MNKIDTGGHGKRCPKVQHVGEGYLHAADDDSPYDVDGVLYCGRCHAWLDEGSSAREPKGDDQLRDDFAAAALAGVEMTVLHDVRASYDRIASHCYRMADAMLRARKEPPC